MAQQLLEQLIAAALLGFMVYICRLYFGKAPGPPLPPGPTSLPIIGNIMALPPKGMPEFQHWLKHKDLYGPISSVTVMGQTLIIIHDKDAAYYMLDKLSSKTSGRPKVGYAMKLCLHDKFMPMKQYNDDFRRYRKAFQQHVGTTQKVAQYNDVQEIEARRLLVRILHRPDDLIQLFKISLGAITLQITYGYSVQATGVDPIISLAERMLDNLTKSMVPLNWLVDIIPALRYLPSGFPGAGFKKTAKEWSVTTKAVLDIPLEFVKQQMEKQNHRPSIVSRALEQARQENNDDDEFIKYTASTVYVGAVEATSMSLVFFVLAMVKFPDVQCKAQAEIDSVIGTGRLARLEDRERLPYVEALIKEVYRWFPVAPMGVAHACDEEFIYSGYRIPKGAYFLPAVWWFFHDDQVYADPSCFDPNRFLAPRNEPDPKPVAFGYGRRACAGMKLAESTVFIIVVQILAAFHIGKKIDGEGKEMEASLKPSPGLTCHPEEFPFSISPRSSHHVQLIRSVEVEHPWEDHAGLLDTWRLT